MTNNPFTSRVYQDVWLKHFAKPKAGKQFQFIKNLSFIKHHVLPYYINTGKNMTNGITYELNELAVDFKNKTFVVYDVPDYFETNRTPKHGALKICKVPQYKGFLANFYQVGSFSEYFQNTLSSKSRNKFRSALKKFESCFDVSYQYYCGDMAPEEYENMMADFKNLVTNRYGDLKIDTNLINEWPFYSELVYRMLKEKKALIVSIEVDGKPISMSLSFLGENTLVGAMKAFNTDFYKFNVGHIEISKFIEWCFENDLEILDFSKGEYEYKTKWTNTNYLYNCHVIYDYSSITSRITAFLLIHYFELKQYLRDKHFNLFIAKTRFKIKNFGFKKAEKQLFKIQALANNLDKSEFQLINLDTEMGVYPFLKRLILDGLYQKPEPLADLKIYKGSGISDSKPKFVVQGNKGSYIIEIL